jgi:hypothetical protein
LDKLLLTVAVAVPKRTAPLVVAQVDQAVAVDTPQTLQFEAGQVLQAKEPQEEPLHMHHHI